MKRKIFFLSSEEYSKYVVEDINGYFDKGYEIEKILDAKCGYYIILVSKCNENYDYAKKLDLSKKYDLIEENDKTNEKCNFTTTKNINFVYS